MASSRVKVLTRINIKCCHDIQGSNAGKSWVATAIIQVLRRVVN